LERGNGKAVRWITKKYSLSMLPDKSVWIVNRFDEGMRVCKEDFDDLIDKFFKEKF